MLPSGAWLRARLQRGGIDRPAEIGLVALCLLALIVFTAHAPYADGDIRIYHRYAVEFWAGHHAFHQLPAEYPPLALVAFTLSVLPPLPYFSTVFAIWMAGLLLGGYLAFSHFASRRRARLLMVYLVAGAAGTVLARYDLVPALLTVAALWACQRGRFNMAYLLLSAGILLKLYPVFLVPMVLIEHRRALVSSAQPWLRAVARGAGIAAAPVVAGFTIAVLLGGWSGLSPFFYAGARPLQVESLGATLLWLSSFAGFSAEVEHSFFSYNLIGPLGPGIAAASTTAGVAGILWVYWRQWSARISITRGFLAVICLVLLSSKVFSPQYLIWAIPLVVLVEDLDSVWLLACICTTLIYPVLYISEDIFGTPGPFPYSGTFLGMIAVRNAVLVAVTIRTLVPVRAPRPVITPAREAAETGSHAGPLPGMGD